MTGTGGWAERDRDDSSAQTSSPVTPPPPPPVNPAPDPAAPAPTAATPPITAAPAVASTTAANLTPTSRPRAQIPTKVWWALGAAVALVIVGGTAYALGRTSPDQVATPVASDDPQITMNDEAIPVETTALDVSAPFVNQPCSGEYVVLLESTGRPADYVSAIDRAAAANTGVSYLRTDESCDGFFQEIDGNPIYAAYLGPYVDQWDACAARYEAVNASGNPRVVWLDSDRSANRPLCVCLDYASDMAVIDTGVAADPDRDLSLVIHDFHDALARLGYDTGKDASGFDDDASGAVRRYQENNDLTVDGWVGTETWSSLLAEPRVCP